MSDAPISGSIEIPASADIEKIIRAAGGLPANAVYGAGVLTVRGVTEEALVAAAAGADLLFGERRMVMARAAAELTRLVAAGMVWGGKLLQIDEASQQRLTSAALTATTGPLPPAFQWRMADNSPLPVTGTDMVAMARAAMAYVSDLRAHYWTIVDAALAAPDAETLAAIDVEAGWPDPPADEFAPPG